MPNFELSNSQMYITDEPSPILGNQSDHYHNQFKVRFWGVRGLIPTPTSCNSRYGGNTSCVEIFVGGQRLIFDGGTGLRILGRSWQKIDKPLEAHLFFTNSQSNRIQGFPFFAPAFIPDNCFHIYGTAASNGASIKQCLCDQMLQPHFPYPLQAMQSTLEFYNITPGKFIEVHDVKVKTQLVNKTQRSMGYRISWQGYNVAYATDVHKIINSQEQTRILEIIENADLWITNATYTPPPDHQHESVESFWKTSVELAQMAKVKKLIISQHHPDDDDNCLDKMQDQIKSIFPHGLLACEGMILSVNR